MSYVLKASAGAVRLMVSGQPGPPESAMSALQSHPHGASFIAFKIPLIKCLDMMEAKTGVGLIVPALIVPRKIIAGHGPVSSGGTSLWYHLH